MRLNQYLAQNTQLSRRGADTAISEGRVVVNGQNPSPGHQVQASDQVYLNDKLVMPHSTSKTLLLLNKPTGYVCSRDGQGSKTIYELLPQEFQRLNPAGRLDKNSSGLLVLTDDGDLANQLTHPKYGKIKVYEIALKEPLQPLHHQMISDFGIQLEDGPSKLQVEKLNDQGTKLRITMAEGRNRQIRRTFAALGYHVSMLNRTHFGDYHLGKLLPGEIKVV